MNRHIEERIYGLSNMRPGDWAVTKNGTEYRIVQIDCTDDEAPLRVHADFMDDFDACAPMDRTTLAYAVRKYEVPEAPGLYASNDGDIWQFGKDFKCRRLTVDGRTTSSTEWHNADYKLAPYTRFVPVSRFD